MDKLNLFMPLTKVDAVQRLVYLTMTAERPDKSREIMDYASGKPAVQKWSDAIKAASGGESLGNVRLMHGKDPIGKLTEIVYDDDAKSIECCVKVVSDAAWKLVDERVLTGGSIGGGYAKRWPDPVQKGLTRYTPELSEFSLVDNPCLPEAVFSLVKADGIVEEVHFAKSVQAYEPGREATLELADELAKAAGKPDRRNDFVVKARAELIKRHAEAEEVVPDPAEALAAALAKAKATVPGKPYGDVEYADASAGKYPIDTPAHIRAAWSYVNMPKNASVLGDKADAVKAKIVDAWKAKIDKDGPPSMEKAAFFGALFKSGAARPLLVAMEKISLEKGFYTAIRVGRVLADLSEIAESVIWEEAWEQDGESTQPQSILDLMAATRSLMIDTINEETAEFFSQAEKSGGDCIALLAPCLDADGMEEMALSARAGELQKLHTADTVLMEKVGKRMSGADMKHVQAMHDHSATLGAKCDSGNCDKVAPTDALAKAAKLEELVTEATAALGKLTTDRDTDRAAIAGLTKELGDTKATLEKISRYAAPAKGAVFAIEKDGTVVALDPKTAPTVTTGYDHAHAMALPPGPERHAYLAKFTG